MEKEQMKSENSSVGSFLWELVKIVIIAAVIIVPIRFLIAQPFSVKGASMEENFSNLDYLIVDQISYRFKEIERGDVVVFRFPRQPSEFYIKRIIGLPGETVKIENGGVWICNNDYPECLELEEDYLSPHERTPGSKEIEVGPGNYVVLGDNRNASSDSRSWGLLPEDYIVGKVLLRAWPFSEFQTIESPSYNI